MSLNFIQKQLVDIHQDLQQGHIADSSLLTVQFYIAMLQNT